MQGVFSGTDLWHVDVLVEPWSDQRFSPFARHRRRPLPQHPQPEPGRRAVDTNAQASRRRGVGVRYYLTDRFVMSADYALYTAFVSDQKTTEYRAWTAGLAFFF